jgi:cyanosortase A-associated protein
MHVTLKRYPWQSWLFLSLVGFLILVISRMVLDPRMGKPQPFAYPAQIPVTGWQSSKAEPLESPDQFRAEILASQRYYYQAASGGQPLTVDSRYYVARKIPTQTKELANAFMFKKADYLGAPLPFQITQKEFSPGNFYDLFHYQQRAYLNACIDPKGFSNVNIGQIRQRQLAQRRDWQKIVTWLASPTILIDERCVWTQVSMPYTGSDPQPAYRELGRFWAHWQPWWQQHYPKL